jgi:two-component system sensor histidine kinase/response regulator
MENEVSQQKPAVLDLTILLEAFEEVNDDLKNTLRLFLKTIVPQLTAIQQKFDEGDIAGAAEMAHAAKGVANTTGAFRLGTLCGEIDHALRRGDTAHAGVKLRDVAATLSEVAQEIETLL